MLVPVHAQRLAPSVASTSSSSCVCSSVHVKIQRLPCPPSGRRPAGPSCMVTTTSSTRRLVATSASASPAPSSSQLPEEAFFKELDSLLEQFEDPTAETKALALFADRFDAGKLPGFGSLQQAVPKRIYTIEELRLNGIKADNLLSPKDNSLNTTRNIAQGAAVVGLGALAYLSDFDVSRVLSTVVGTAFALVVDQVVNQGGGEALVVDTLGRALLPSYRSRVALHEAGHFLVAYLVGVLPRTYTLSSLDAFQRFRRLNIQAGTQFCDSIFMKEVQGGRLSSSSLDKYTCVALAGVVTEYLRFGQAEGGIGDILQLDGMFRALQFSQLKADGEVRWAVLNVAAMLKQYDALQDRLADEMDRGASVGKLLRMIESEVAGNKPQKQEPQVSSTVPSSDASP